MTKSAAKSLDISSYVMIIHSTNAGLMFGDRLRQKIVWVDGMTDDEATEYAEKEFPVIISFRL